MTTSKASATIASVLFCAVFLLHCGSATMSASVWRNHLPDGVDHMSPHTAAVKEGAASLSDHRNGAPLQQRQQQQCEFNQSTNITRGVSAGQKKFVVSAADCCAYCSSTESCVAALYDNYYCYPFASVQSVDVSPTSQVITLPATTHAPSPPPTTTLAPPPPPPPPASQNFGLLVTCPGAMFCDFVNLAICVAEVVPYESCAYDVRHHSYVSITNTTSGILRKTFRASDCQGAAADELVFPWLCGYDSKQNLSRTAVVEPRLNQPGTYTTTGNICTDLFCFDCPGVTFSGETGSCIANDDHPAASSSSSSGSSRGDSSSDPAVGAANELFYYPSLGSVVIFSYNSTSACEAGDPVVGVGLTTNWCYQVGSHYYTNRVVKN